MNETIQIKNLAGRIEYSDPRKNLMTNFLSPPLQAIISNFAHKEKELKFQNKLFLFH
jgi:hypothetical protein